MRLVRLSFTLVFICMINISFGQFKSFIIQFQPTFGNDVLQLDNHYKLNSRDSIEIETLRFYVSGIELMKDDKKVWEEKKSFHLIDASVSATLNAVMNIPDDIHFNKIKLNIGIDSTTNVSGVMGGDLDPTRGMYWTWQSGYINFKLEGKSSLCNTRNHAFNFHLGGYQYPFNSLQSVILNIKQSEKIIIELDIEKLISNIDLSKQNEVMTPGADAVFILSEIPKAINIIQP